MGDRAFRGLIGIQVVYRSHGGGLIVGGLAYAALFALLPTLVLVIAGVFLLVDDVSVRADAVELINDAFPALAGLTDEAVASARELAAVGGIIAIAGFLWGASGLYLNLTRAMERFFPGERVSGALARIAGVLLVALLIVGVLAAVVVSGVLTVIARALALDSERVMAVAGAVATFIIAAGLVYAIYRVIPARPPRAASARGPALLVGVAVAMLTLLYGLISPWLVSSFAAFGVAASVFAALLWLRLVFLALVYGAAATRYRDYVAAARALGEADPMGFATEHALAEEADRVAREVEASEEVERRRQESAAPGDASARD